MNLKSQEKEQRCKGNKGNDRKPSTAQLHKVSWWANPTKTRPKPVSRRAAPRSTFCPDQQRYAARRDPLGNSQRSGHTRTRTRSVRWEREVGAARGIKVLFLIQMPITNSEIDRVFGTNGLLASALWTYLSRLLSLRSKKMSTNLASSVPCSCNGDKRSGRASKVLDWFLS